MSTDPKSKNPKRKNLNQNPNAFPTVRKIQSRINSIHAMMLRNSPGTKVLDELAKVRDLLMQLEAGIFKSQLRGSFHEALQTKDPDTMEDTICRLANHFARKDEK